MIRDMCDILHNEQLFSLGAEKRDGDGFKMALDAGGAFAPGKGTLAWCGPAIYGSGWCTHGYAAAVQPTLWVNQDAKRFFPEDQWLASFAAAGTAMAKEEKTFVIMSENDVKYFEETGAYVNVFTWMRTGNPMTELREQFEANPNIYKCDTIEDVAAKLGLDAAALKATLTKYNAACEAGVDDEFGKDPVHMRKLEAPFWCAQAADGFYCTVGGLYVSDQFECMTKDNKIIPGLYAGGCDAGGLFGDSYDVLVCPGTCASFAVNSGRIIAKAAKKFLGK